MYQALAQAELESPDAAWEAFVAAGKTLSMPSRQWAIEYCPREPPAKPAHTYSEMPALACKISRLAPLQFMSYHRERA